MPVRFIVDTGATDTVLAPAEHPEHPHLSAREQQDLARALALLQRVVASQPTTAVAP